MTELFDAHCHLDPGAVVGTTVYPSEGGRLLCGVGPADWRAIEKLATLWPGTIPAFGLHPWHIHDADGDWLDALETMLTNNNGSWLGEAGLDARRQGIAPARDQEEAFAAQLRLAARLRRPVNLHCVGAWDALLEQLDAAYLPGMAFVVHGFGGPYQFVKSLAERGAYFSVGPLISGGTSRKAAERAKLIPADRILLESDAFLLPGVDAEETLAQALDWLARVRGTDAGELRAGIAANVRKVFS